MTNHPAPMKGCKCYTCVEGRRIKRESRGSSKSRSLRVANRVSFLLNQLGFRPVEIPTAAAWAKLVTRLARAEVRIEELEAQVAGDETRRHPVPKIVTGSADLGRMVHQIVEDVLARGSQGTPSERAIKPHRRSKR